MNQEIKERLEQEAANFGKLCDPNNETLEKQADLRFGFVRGAQAILENPSEWGLVSKGSFNRKEFFRKAWRGRAAKAESQLAKYREALERIVQGNCSPILVAKEALKQEDTTCPKCGYPLFNHLGKTCCQGCDYVKQQ